MPESVGCSQVFRKKPGFWGLASHQRNRVSPTKETGFLPESVGCSQVFRKKPGFWGPAVGFFCGWAIWFLGGWAIEFDLLVR
ncbi:MAG: hypothetical protein EAZ83_13190 [Oscillatoriales cyanobacterium]|nr:MAG: hypothetical protein EAZ83_13190 [Oscillatoriales cyanobacterium]